MLKISFILLVVIALIIGLAILINKFLPLKSRKLVSIILWLLCFVLGYFIYMSIMAPISFEKTKKERYQVAVNKLIDLKKSQVGYKSLHGKYASSFEELIKFIETERFAIVQRKDTSVPDVARNAQFGLSNGVGGFYRDVVIIDTLGYKSVKDSLFKNSDRYKTMNVVNVSGKEIPVVLQTGEVESKENKISVFQAVIDKNALLEGLDKDLVAQEKKKKAIDEINGDKIILGSLQEVTTTGNWPKQYGNNE